MSRDQRPSEDRAALEQALLAFDQQLQPADQHESVCDLPSSAAPSLAVDGDTNAELQANVETLRLLNAVRIVDESAEEIDHRIGRFEIVEELGRGGYGVVLLARDPRLNRLVALKVPRPEAIVTPDLRTRFLREAEAAAALNHPNILPIFEQGSTGPICFIAMAYCEGPSLLEWINENGPLKPQVAAQLVATLADALQHAHNRGVLHRDVKPANVLLDVAAGKADQFDAAALPAVVRLTDFGLARIGEDQGQTRTGDILGTPLYMSPEQAAGRRDLIGTATDTYALGATLYFLLTGKPPLQGVNEMQTLLAIQNQDPAAASHHDANIPKDLDAICLKCLEKNPGLRYRSATDLASDLERFVNGVPVRARKITPLVRAGRWCSRNPVLATAIGLICAVTAASFVWINHERNVARLEARRTADVLRVVSDAFQSVDPLKGNAKDRTAIDVLAFAKKSMDRSALDDVGKRQLLKTLTQSFVGLGEYVAATESAEEYADLCRRTLGSDADETLEAQLELVKVYSATAPSAEYVDLIQDNASSFEAKFGFEHEKTLNSYSELATAYYQLGQVDDAIALNERIINAYPHITSDDPSQVSANEDATRQNLGAFYVSTGRFDEGAILLAESLAFRKDNFGEAHWETITAQTNLAACYENQGRFDQAIELYEHSLRSRNQSLGEDHPLTMAALNNTASVYMKTGRADKALPMNEKAVAVRTEKLGPKHRLTLHSMHQLAFSHELLGDLDKAIETYEWVLKIRTEEFGLTDDETLVSLNYLGYAYKANEQYGKAAEVYKQASKANRIAKGDAHADTLINMGNYGSTLCKMKRYEDAISVLGDCLSKASSSDGLRSIAGNTQSLLGEAHAMNENSEAAEQHLRAGYRTLDQLHREQPTAEETDKLQGAIQRLIEFSREQDDLEGASEWEQRLKSLELVD